jgi:hypothetical protein
MPRITKAHLDSLLQNPPTEPPVLRCHIAGNQLVTESCPFCGQVHWHGNAGTGHRAAHCITPDYVDRPGLRDAWRRAISVGYTLYLGADR